MPLQDLLFKVPTIKKAWRAGQNQEVSHDDVPLPEICEDLNKCVKKLSLGTSSILIKGAVRTYNAELDELLNDVMKLEKGMMTRRKTSDKEKQFESSSKSSTTQPSRTSDLESNKQTTSTSKKTSRFRSRSEFQPRHTSQPRSTSQPRPTSQPESKSQPGSTSQPRSTSQLGSISQPRSTSLHGSASQPGSISQPISKSQAESTFQLGSTSQPGSTSQLGSMSQPRSTSQPESTSQPRSTTQPGDSSTPEQSQSECSSDHEDYFPLPTGSPEHMRNSKCSSNYEEISQTYTTTETKWRESLLNPARFHPLSTISEENSTRRSAATSGLETSSAIDKNVQDRRSKSKRSSSDTVSSSNTPEQERFEETDSSSNASEQERFEQSRTNKKRSRSGPGLSESSITPTKERATVSDTDAKHKKSTASIILQSSNKRDTKNKQESRKRQKTDTSVDLTESIISRLERTRITNVISEELGHTGIRKTLIRTEKSIEDSSSGASDEMLLEQSIILQSSNILKAEDRQKKKNNAKGPPHTDQNTLVRSNVLELGQNSLDAGTSHTIIVHDTQASPCQPDVPKSRYPSKAGKSRDKDQRKQLGSLQSNLLESRLVPDETSGVNNNRDQATEADPLQSDVELGADIRFDRNRTFGSVALYGQCQCDPIVPCAIIYSCVEE